MVHRSNYTESMHQYLKGNSAQFTLEDQFTSNALGWVLAAASMLDPVGVLQNGLDYLNSDLINIAFGCFNLVEDSTMLKIFTWQSHFFRRRFCQ